MFFRSEIRNPARSASFQAVRRNLALTTKSVLFSRRKPQTMTEIEMLQLTTTWNFQCISFGHFVIRYSNLFRICGRRLEKRRISIFGFCLNMTFRSRTTDKAGGLRFPTHQVWLPKILSYVLIHGNYSGSRFQGSPERSSMVQRFRG
jgi:hypothetical protein